MYFEIKNNEQAILSAKAKEDAESIKLMVYNLIKFAADIKLAPDQIAHLTETLKPMESFQDSIKWALKHYEDRKK